MKISLNLFDFHGRSLFWLPGRSWNTRVVHNRPYAKKMNLANDISSWSCWEIYVEDDDFTTAMVVLRPRRPFDVTS